MHMAIFVYKIQSTSTVRESKV